jgi:hypothetical protein
MEDDDMDTALNRNSLPPSIEGGLHCVFIAVVLQIIGLVLFRMGYVAGVVFYFVATPFQIGALLCAIFGICHGSIKHGLALLAGVGVLCALVVFGPLWGIAKVRTTTSPMMEDASKMWEQRLRPPQP